jgi:hypothetical protein
MPKHTRKREVVLTVILGLAGLIGVLSSAEAVLTVRSAAVVNGVAVVEGGNAPRGAPISWEGARVTQANNGGNFAFQGVVPADCVGRLEDGVAADAIDVALANCGPSSAVPAPVPQTGQTNCYAGGALIPCDSTGQDGAIQAGVPWPTPRFTDNGDGTVRDNLTGLIWLKQANCLGSVPWADALAAAHTLASGQCGLTDGSVPGDWRLPNIRELLSLIDFGSESPALSNTAGTGTLTEGDPFVGVGLGGLYWSSTSAGVSADIASIHAWLVSFQSGGGVTSALLKSDPSGVWPVRGGR